MSKKETTDKNLSTSILKEMIDIIDSDDTDYKKAEKLYHIYPSISSLERAYPSFSRFLPLYEGEEKAKIYEKEYRRVKKIYEDYQNRGILDKVKEIIENKVYYETYQYSKFIIDSFIRWNGKFKRFCMFYGIDEKTFEFCLSAIEELDIELYKDYKYKISVTKKEEQDKKEEIIKDLAFGIKTGVLKDGTKFDLLEFLKRVPFIHDKEDFIHNITIFMRKNNKEEQSIILKYIKENNMYSARFFDKLSVPAIYQTKIIINDRELTNDDKDIIINYITENNLPLITKTYILVRTKYLNGTLEETKVKTKEKNIKKRILIP